VTAVRDWQRRLNSYGYSLAVDNIAGPQTYSAMFAFMGAKDTASQFGAAAADYWPQFQITTSLRIAHFISQAAEETGSFRYLTELWGPTAAQEAYEGSKALGNTQPGDGYKYRGRGIFQLTGRANYQRYAQRLGVDLVTNPNLAAGPVVALHIACLYWNDLSLNQFADRDDGRSVGNGINRGNPGSPRMPNGYAERQAQLARAKMVLS